MLAVMKRILLALFGAREIEIAAQSVGDGEVGLQDAAEHLLVQLFLERLGVAQNYIGVGIFGVEIGDDFRIILVAEPRIIVDEAVAVNDGFNRLTPRDRWPRRAGILRIGRKTLSSDVGVGVHGSFCSVRAARSGGRAR